MVVIEDLIKKFKYFNALDHVSIKIGKGQIFGIVGAKGAGKTTLMKIMAGVLMPNSGLIEINGLNLYKESRNIKRMTGYVPDGNYVYDDLKVVEYMEFYAGIHGIPSRECNKIVDQLLELIELKDKKDEYVRSLSSGKKKWLCTARALIHNPELIILDEPSIGLDPTEWDEMMDMIKTLRQMGKTILISSQFLPEISKLGTSFGILEHGKFIAKGSIDEVTKKH